MATESIVAGEAMGKTTIQIEEETRDRLKDIGKMGDSYDSVIRRLLDFYAEHKSDRS